VPITVEASHSSDLSAQAGERKRALITGITGQDGSYLAELLLSKNYDVHGIVRRSSSFNTARIDHLLRPGRCSRTTGNFHLHYGDMTDEGGLRRVLEEVRPDEIYHLAAQSHVKLSFELPIYTSDVVALGTARLLEAVRDYQDRTSHRPRIYYAASSEMFGISPPPQNEDTPFRPVSPYAAAKVYGYHLARCYSTAYGLWIARGILFNHESPRRGETFVTRKITRAIGRILASVQDQVFLGNLHAWRDWGYAPDYVHAMWLMLQADKPDDYVVGTGKATTVETFAAMAFKAAGLDWRNHIEIDERYLRSNEVEALRADASKAAEILGWRPEIELDEMIRIMVEHDIELARREKMAL
jgi:GDPmannose 4,6-dehydratase